MCVQTGLFAEPKGFHNLEDKLLKNRCISIPFLSANIGRSTLALPRTMEAQAQPEKRVDTAALSVVVAGKHEYILQSTSRILEGAGYAVAGAAERDEVRSLLVKKEADVLFISGGVEPSDRQALLDYVNEEAPHITVVEHFGGPATILSELAEALRQQAKKG